MLDWFEEYGIYVFGILLTLLIIAPETAAGAFAAWALVSFFVVFCATFLGCCFGGGVGIVAFVTSVITCIGAGLSSL